VKYAIWAVRFWYAGWMIPAGLEHFYHIYPQPGYDTTNPLAHEMLFALLHSHLFDIVKAVELITGISVLLGFFTPLMLLVCMPVAFCVFWWDAPLSVWNMSSVIAGGRVLAFNILLSVAFIASYRSMFAVRSKPAGAAAVQQLALASRLIFGAWMLVNGLNHFFFSFWSTPGGHEPLAVELMGALAHSHLLDVAMLIELVTGALILTGFFVPAALCVVMPVSTCALYWSILDRQPSSMLFGLAAFALNGFLMLTCLGYYKGALQRTALTLGESGRSMIWDTLFVRPKGRTARGQFAAALIPLAFVVWCYAGSGPNIYAPWDLLVLVYPAVVLHARRLHDMGRSAWLLLVPTVLTIAAMGIWARRISLGTQLDSAVPVAALVVFIGFALWGCVGKGQTEANSFGPPVTA
jgi:uncharacterized membrane protein YhaH (DUF805 family)/uncharacterized membrane protein YphA (DoxX/SURF4 family)